MNDLLERYGAKALTEASLSRIVRHAKAADGFAILSADRHERTPAENKEARKRLEQQVRSLGKGFIRVRGGYVEKADNDDEEGKPVYEESLFVPDVDTKLGQKLAQIAGAQYGQEAILWGDGERVYVMYGSGRVGDSLGRLSLNTLSQYFTEWRGRRFTFECLAYVPGGMFSGLAFERDVARCADG